MPSIALAAICQSLYNQAILKPGAMFSAILARGLMIYVRINDNQVDLLLSRETIYPSKSELNTVLKYWPWRIKEVQPETLQHKNRYYIKAKFPCCQ